MALSPQTELLTVADLKTAVGDNTIPEDTFTLAVQATKAHVLRYHSVASVTVDGTITWPYDFKLGAVKLAAGLVRSGFSAATSSDPNDPLSQATLNRLTDLEIEQLLRIGRAQEPRIG